MPTNALVDFDIEQAVIDEHVRRLLAFLDELEAAEPPIEQPAEESYA